MKRAFSVIVFSVIIPMMHINGDSEQIKLAKELVDAAVQQAETNPCGVWSIRQFNCERLAKGLPGYVFVVDPNLEQVLLSGCQFHTIPHQSHLFKTYQDQGARAVIAAGQTKTPITQYDWFDDKGNKKRKTVYVEAVTTKNGQFFIGSGFFEN